MFFKIQCDKCRNSLYINDETNNYYNSGSAGGDIRILTSNNRKVTIYCEKCGNKITIVCDK